MAFPIDPGRPPGIQPLEDQVPKQGNVDPRAMLPLANAREQQHHDVRQHAGLGHGQHDDQDMNLEDMLPLRQAFNLDQDDAMLEDDNNQLREQSIHSFNQPIHQLYLTIGFSFWQEPLEINNLQNGISNRSWKTTRNPTP